MQRENRRLAAIVAADIAEYSRLVGQDEEGTLRALRAHRQELIDRLIEGHGGRIANTAGDSLLLEFSSVVDAVRCSVAVQEGMTARNRDIEENRQIRFRVGIHVGDVVAEGDDLLGDSVNVAARLESLSDSGGAVLSDDAYRQVRDRLDLVWQDDGEHKLKNIVRPVRVWRWSPKTDQASANSAADAPLAFQDAHKDGSMGPEMVVIPAGSFMMGSPEVEQGWQNTESPRHSVTFAQAFAIGKYAVTVEEYDRFCESTNREPRGGRVPGKHPVTWVSWKDSKVYATWLSEQTGKYYRLLTEAEWEYAARAWTQTPFSSGRTITPDKANYDGNFSYGGGPEGRYLEKTAPVGSYPANAFGLHDMHGNVWEWVEDCWHDSYDGAPDDGAAWISGGNCDMRVLRGGSWFSIPRNLRSANRFEFGSGSRYDGIGFRVARTFER